MASATLTATGTSDWVDCTSQFPHRLDVDVPAGVTVAYTIETTHDKTNGVAKTIKNPNDVTTNWDFDDSTAIEVKGRGYYRMNISSFTGTGEVVLTAGATRAG